MDSLSLAFNLFFPLLECQPLLEPLSRKQDMREKKSHKSQRVVLNVHCSQRDAVIELHARSVTFLSAMILSSCMERQPGSLDNPRS